MFVKIVPHRCIEGICVAFLLTGVNVDFKISGSALLEASDDPASIQSIFGVTFENLEQFVDRLLRRILPRRRDTDRVGEVAQGILQGSGFSRRRHLSEVEVKMDLLHNIPHSRVQTTSLLAVLSVEKCSHQSFLSCH